MFRYDAKVDEYVEVEFDEFSSDEPDEEDLNPTDTVKSLYPLLVLRKQRRKRFEIVAVAEGSSTITGQVSQNRTTYSNSDIMWGHRFLPCVDYDETKKTYIVDYKKFKQVIPFDTPLCSARKLAELQKRLPDLETANQEQEKSRLEKINDEDKGSMDSSIHNYKSREDRIPEVFRKLFHNESVHDFKSMLQ